MGHGVADYAYETNYNGEFKFKFKLQTSCSRSFSSGCISVRVEATLNQNGKVEEPHHPQPIAQSSQKWNQETKVEPLRISEGS
ncbi:hypothetical protein COCON_G00176740 [Conger conger]|uniref:Uncharacterized protein n=1 Tax=Conger conger TaxID=82655 RepID=A0A9Q1D5I1_CONCO|nr:hypothetical protein COCON_G00176740 [Conger conger]